MDVSKEFPGIPPDFNDFRVSPNPFDGDSYKELTIKNHSKVAVLFKVKCTSNKHVKIEDCADILRPGNETTVSITKLVADTYNDSLYVIYTIVGKQWHDERMSAYRCWERAKKQAVPTRYISVRMRKPKKKKVEEKKDEDDDKEKSKSRSHEEEEEE